MRGRERLHTLSHTSERVTCQTSYFIGFQDYCYLSSPWWCTNNRRISTFLRFLFFWNNSFSRFFPGFLGNGRSFFMDPGPSLGNAAASDLAANNRLSPKPWTDNRLLPNPKKSMVETSRIWNRPWAMQLLYYNQSLYCATRYTNLLFAIDNCFPRSGNFSL